jgi:hypothetical protein
VYQQRLGVVDRDQSNSGTDAHADTNLTRGYRNANTHADSNVAADYGDLHTDPHADGVEHGDIQLYWWTPTVGCAGRRNLHNC